MPLSITVTNIRVPCGKGNSTNRESNRIATLLVSLQWRHNGRDGVSNHRPYDCLLNRLFRRRSKKTSKPRVTGLWAGNSPGTGEFPAQMASYAEIVSIWWRHHDDMNAFTTQLQISTHKAFKQLFAELFQKHESIFTFYIIVKHWYGIGGRSPPPWTIMLWSILWLLIAQWWEGPI